MCGTGVGTLVLPPIVEHFIQLCGWRGAMRCLAGLCLGSVLCGAAMFPARRSGDQEKEQEAGADNARRELRGLRYVLSLVVGESLASSPTLVLFFTVMAGDFLATMSLYIPYTHLPDMAIARGVEPSDAAFLISSAGISSTLGRVLAGVLCDQGRLHPLTITLLANSLAALQSLLLAR